MENSIMRLITDSVKERLGDGYKITTQDVTKNNGLVLKGLTIKHGTENICPTIYLNSFVDDYLNNVPLEKIVEHIIHIYQEHKSDYYDISYFCCFEKIKGKIIYQLINTDKNKDLLKVIPSISYLDLSIIFKVIVDSPNATGISTITINNSYLEMWNVTVTDIHLLAKENTPRLMPAKIKNIFNIMQELCPGNMKEIFSFDNALPMYVLTNTNCVNGSCCILYPNVLANFADAVDSDIYVLPSSVHETILLTGIPNHLDTSYLKQMVSEVNTTEVSDEEILSDSVYLFSKETHTLSQI